MKSSNIKARKHNLGRKTTENIEFDFNRKKKHSFIADIEQQVDQIKRK